MSLEENMEEILNIDVENVKKPNLPKVKSRIGNTTTVERRRI